MPVRLPLRRPPAAGVEVLYDDRDERPGSKFKDKARTSKDVDLVPVEDLARVIAARVKEALAKGRA